MAKANVTNGTFRALARCSKHQTAGGQEVMLDTQTLQLVLAVLAILALSTEIYLRNRRF